MQIPDQNTCTYTLITETVIERDAVNARLSNLAMEVWKNQLAL